MRAEVGFTVESLSADRAIQKLAREGIEVSARKLQKNAVDIRIRAKDSKKSFAILQGSCYNIKNVRYYGLEKLRRAALRGMGLIVGCILFLAGTLFLESRVLTCEVVGSGAYYEREVRQILSEEGVTPLSPLPKETGHIVARVLSLPRVEFCTVAGRGGVLTVTVRCVGDIAPLAGIDLIAPASGRLEALFIVKGTPLHAVGEQVREGEAVVAAEGGVVIARLAVSFPVAREYQGETEEEALGMAQFDFGDLTEIHTQKTESGWKIEGVAHVAASLNLD